MLLYPLYKAATARSSVRAELGKIVTKTVRTGVGHRETCWQSLNGGPECLTSPRRRPSRQRLLRGMLLALER